jgi:hypothetical protein
VDVLGDCLFDVAAAAELVSIIWHSRSALQWGNRHGLAASVQSDVASFVTSFVIGRLVPTLAAFFVLRAILDTASGGHPLPSVLTAMFLLGVQTTYSLMQSYNTGTSYATDFCYRV